MYLSMFNGSDEASGHCHPEQSLSGLARILHFQIDICDQHTITFTVNLGENGKARKCSYKVRHVYRQQASPNRG